MDQIIKSKHLSDFDDFAKRTWEHSLQAAAISRVLSRRLGRGNPDEAMLAGLVHDIGIFYLLYRAAEYEEYRSNREAVLELVLGWHESIGESLLHILGLPDRIVVAIRDHDHLHNINHPCTLADILYFANLLAGGKFEWLTDVADPEESAAIADARERFGAIVSEAEEDISELRAALAS